MACDMCNPVTWRVGSVDFFKFGTQSDLDIAYATHKLEVHCEKSQFVVEKEFYKMLEQKYPTIPGGVTVDGVERIPCPKENCSTYFAKTSVTSYRVHCHYHEVLEEKTLSYSENFPCLNCPFESESYHNLSQHMDTEHPRFSYQCPVPDCPYRSTAFRRRQDHYRESHKNSLHTKVVFTCEV